MKEEIIKRLVEAGHIDFYEALILMGGYTISYTASHPNPYTYTAGN